jgi:hypothetical protein
MTTERDKGEERSSKGVIDTVETGASSRIIFEITIDGCENRWQPDPEVEDRCSKARSQMIAEMITGNPDES